MALLHTETHVIEGDNASEVQNEARDLVEPRPPPAEPVLPASRGLSGRHETRERPACPWGSASGSGRKMLGLGAWKIADEYGVVYLTSAAKTMGK